jgi:hypothetical protein
VAWQPQLIFFRDRGEDRWHGSHNCSCFEIGERTGVAWKPLGADI